MLDDKHNLINGKAISPIGFGCGFRVQSESSEWFKLANILQSAAHMGFSYFDTAEIYGHGLSEELLGKSFSSLDHSRLAIGTKVSPENLTAKKIISSAEQSLKRLRMERIDLYQIHWSNPAIPIGETMSALARLVESGKVAQVGVCNFSLTELKEAEQAFHPHKISVVQLELNLLDRSAEKSLIPYCKESGKIVLAYSPLIQGKIPGGPSSKKVLTDIAAEVSAPVEAVILNWIYAHCGCIPIPNTTKLDRLADYAAGLKISLSKVQLDSISKTFPYRPVEMDPGIIQVAAEGTWSPTAFRTLQEAIENAPGLRPSPVELAEQLKQGEFLKPPRVRPLQSSVTRKAQYELLEGRTRYWAWLIAFGDKSPIPVLIHY